jgi:hypothetical protein
VFLYCFVIFSNLFTSSKIYMYICKYWRSLRIRFFDLLSSPMSPSSFEKLWNIQHIVIIVGAYFKSIFKLRIIWIYFLIPKAYSILTLPILHFLLNKLCWGVTITFELKHFIVPICKGYVESPIRYGWTSSLPILK